MRFSYQFLPDGSYATELKAEEMAQGLVSPGILWIHFWQLAGEDVEILSQVFKFHPLAIEDCLHRHTHPKIEEYENCLFLVVYGPGFKGYEEDFSPWEHDIFLGENFLVTVHDQESAVVNQVRERVERNPAVAVKSPCMLMYHLLDAVIDSYFPVLERLEQRLEGIEKQLFEHFSEAALKRIFATKKEVLAIRRLLAIQREIFSTLTHRELRYVKAPTQTYLRDVYDHIIRLFDSLEIMRELLFSALEAYTSQVSNKMNSIMKTLSIVATIMLPLTLIASIFGMNFTVIPGLESALGFWGTMGGMGALGAWLVWYFKKKGWW